MEDVRLGRKTVTQQRNVTVPVSSIPVVQRSPNRILLVFFPPLSGTITLQVSGTAVQDAGINLTSASHPLVMNVKDYGDVVTKDWDAIHSVGGVTLAILEGLLEAK
jgi:hypothetical protein